MASLSLHPLSFAAVIACGANPEPADTAPAPRTEACPTGTIGGVVWNGYLGGDENVPQPGAALFASQGSDPPLEIQADAEGHWTATLAAGAWLIEGNGGGCLTMEPASVWVEACEERSVDIYLDICKG